MTVLADRIHVMPPDWFLEHRRRQAHPSGTGALQRPADADRSLLLLSGLRPAHAMLRHRSVGDGSDGTLGLSEIRAAGGRTMVEDPKSAQFPDMPQSAIDAGMADTILPAEAMANAVVAIANQIIAVPPGMTGRLHRKSKPACGHSGHPARRGRARLSLLQAQHPRAADPPEDDPGQDRDHGGLCPTPLGTPG